MLRLPYFPTDLKLTTVTLPLYKELLAAHLQQLLDEAATMPECAVDTEYWQHECRDPYAKIAQKLISMERKLPLDVAKHIGLTSDLVAAVRRERARRFLAWEVRNWQYWVIDRGRGVDEFERARIRRAMRRNKISASEIGFPVS